CRVDSGLWKKAVWRIAKQQNSTHGHAFLYHNLGVQKQRYPGRIVFVRRRGLLTNAAEIIPQPPPVEIVERRPRNRPQFGADRTALLEETAELLRARFPTLRPHADVIGIAVVVPQAVNVETACHTDNGDVLSGLDVADDFKERNYSGTNFVAASRH